MKKISAFSRIFAVATLAGLAFTLAGCGKKLTVPGDSPPADAPSKPAKNNKRNNNSGGQSSVAFYNDFLGFRGVSQSSLKSSRKPSKKAKNTSGAIRATPGRIGAGSSRPIRKSPKSPATISPLRRILPKKTRPISTPASRP
jgi:predicted small lipoprotein YifL